MNIKSNYQYLLSDLSKLKGIGTKTSNLLKRKKINTIFDILWKLPKSYTDRSKSSKIKDLKIVIIKIGIFMSLAAYWGVILVGTFITFN